MTPNEITEMFARLGDPDGIGKAFAITRDASLSVEDVSALPKPDYDHQIWLDDITKNFIVVRPDAAGGYWHGGRLDYRDAKITDAWKRVR